jgi:hypothetical protein
MRDLFSTWDPYSLDSPPPPNPPIVAPIPVAPTVQRAKVVQDLAVDLAENDIYARWLCFHVENPHVYRTLREIALEAKEVEERTKFGIAAIVEVARWKRRFTTTGEDYKMPNAFRAMYSRLLMEQVESLKDFFDTAELRSAVWPMDSVSISARTNSVKVGSF